MDNLKFYVVLCSHNGSSFIEEQIRSILNNGTAIMAIHIHDFASTDDTRRILARLRIEYAEQLNVTYHADAPGASASFIRALRLIEPLLMDESLVFLSDQDDVWLPNKLGTVIDELAARRLAPNSPFLLFHDVEVVDENLQRVRRSYYTGNPFQIPRDLNRSRLLLANPAIGHTMLMSKALIHEIISWPMADNFMMHDWLAILVANEIGRVEYIDKQLSLYRQHESNILGAYRTRRRVVSFDRLFQLTDELIWQAVNFSQTLRTKGAQRRKNASTNTYLERICGGGYREAALALSVLAFSYGPTWQRKALGFFLFARAFLGPRRKRYTQ